MYLAFESLLSSHYPKTRGLEIDWLRQSLSGASSDLDLRGLASAGCADPVGYVLDTVYTAARLPLFHAKDGKAYFAPVHNTADRKLVTSALSTLTQIVIRMADKWFSARRMGGWVNLNLFEQQNRNLFAGTRFVLSDNPSFTLNDGIDSDSIRNGAAFPAVFSETHDGKPRHNIGGRISVSSIAPRGRLHALYLINDTTPCIGLSPDTTVDLQGFDWFEVLLFIRGRNASAPKYMYAR
jgi:hypothetical protein